MSNFPEFKIDTQWVVSHRGEKNAVDPYQPYAFFVEKERIRTNVIEDVATVFLTNNECPFRCLMCDLWKNTTDKPVPDGAIPGQIEYAMSRLPETKHLKLYNSGSFFDTMAIPKTDYEKIASLIEPFETVTVESHPVFINGNVPYFKDMIRPKLQVAIGLETVHPTVISKLNKKMTLMGFKQAVRYLRKNDIGVRAFILLRPPFLSEDEGVYWAKKSIEYAFRIGVEICTVIPVRAGNGAMEMLSRLGYFEPPLLESLEDVLEYGIGLGSGGVFADLWNIKKFSKCNKCLDTRKERLSQMNLSQTILPPVNCSCSE